MTVHQCDGTMVDVRGSLDEALSECLGSATPGDSHWDADVVVFASVHDLDKGVAEVPAHIPVVLVLGDEDLALGRVPRTAAVLMRNARRVNLLLLRDLSSCQRFARMRIALPVARHDGRQEALRHWVRRAHAYGYVLPPRP